MSENITSAEQVSPAADQAGGASRAQDAPVKHTVTARTKARRRAVEILFEADQRGLLKVSHAQEEPTGDLREGRGRHGERDHGGFDRDWRAREVQESEARGARSEDRYAREDWYSETPTQEPPAQDDSDPADRLREFAAERAVHSANHTQAPPYTREILSGVADHLADIDESIETYAQDWSLQRMPAVDRAIARVATWEIVYNDAVDAPVATDEAMTLARMLSTDDSPRYLGGVLGRIGDLADTLR